MREFFRGWRRKTGLATLAMACMLTIGLMRSYMVIDSLYASRGRTLHELTARAGSLTWLRHSEEDDVVPIQWQSTHFLGPNVRFSYWDGIQEEIEWQRNWVGFSAGTFHVDAGGHSMLLRVEVLSICYWPIILLLTLLSMYLLLTQPRPAKSAKEVAS